MNILVATNQLEIAGGTECYTYALIQELLKRHHNVEYFTFHKGLFAAQIEALGVHFRSKIFYDLILANHNTVVNHLYKRGFIIQTCHGKFIELEQPSPKADLFVSISKEISDYLNSKKLKSHLIFNGIDCDRFKPTKPLHHYLTRVLSLCQSDRANELIQSACNINNIEFHVIEKQKDNIFHIEREINKADLVIGIGRSLYDSMACGRCVMSFDWRTYGDNLGDGYITSANIYDSLEYNCSGRKYKKHWDSQSLAEEMKKYNPSDGVFLRNFALMNLDIEHIVDQYLILAPKNIFFWKIKKFFILFFRNIYWGIKVLFNPKLLQNR